MKYFIQLAYKGTYYKGWQRQPRHPSIQQTLEEVLHKMMGQKINCIGCGRTDSGVHARQFFAHIVVNDPFDFDPVFRLNKMLPDDISIERIFEVARDAHAQHSATSRTYEYYFHQRKSAILSDLSTWHPEANLNFGKIKGLLSQMQGAHDFRAFCKQPDLYKKTLCKITVAQLKEVPDTGQFFFKFTADRFLRGMVRILVAQLLEVAGGRLSEHDFKDSLFEQKGFAYFRSAYPQGLFLTNVEYPDHIEMTVNKK